MVWMTAVEALNILNVRPQTLYANVSRGKIRAKPDGDDPRRSLYHRDDVLRMARRANGRRKVEAVSAQAMAYGDPVLSSSISTADDGRLLYRGRDAATLAETASLEDIAALLWECCTQPHEPENGITRPADAAAKSGGASPALATATARAMATATTTATAMATATVAVPVTSASGALAAGLLSLAHRAAADAPSLGRPVDALRIEAADILATLVAAMSAATARNQEAMLYSTGSPAAPIATRLAHAWRCMPHEDLIRRTLVLMADHELNASTFTCRVAISTGASLAAGVLAGLATLSGPLHGGASAAFAQLAADAQRQGARAAVRAWLDQGRALPAFGHPLYPEGDPRARALIQYLPEYQPYKELATEAEAQAGELPNIDYALSLLSVTCGLPHDAPFVLFAVGRCVGWLAHALEQAQARRLIRPRARYTGPANVSAGIY